MTEEDLQSFIRFGREQRHVEFKGPGSKKDRAFLTKIVRGVLALSNIKGGGHLIIGVADDGEHLTVQGLTEDQLDTWTFDSLADSLQSYAAPFVDFDLSRVEHGNATCIVITVREFATVPVLCAKSYGDAKKETLTKGALYVRTRRKPESMPIGTEADMRELIELATEKRLRETLSLLSRSGVSPENLATDASRFDQQITTGDPSELAQKIRSRGYRRFLVRPEVFQPERVEYAQLRPILGAASVRRRGWDFPHIGQRDEEWRNGQDFVTCESEFGWSKETLRFFQSGLLVMERALKEDWLDEEALLGGKPPPDWKPGTVLRISEAVITLSEFADFVASLAAMHLHLRRVVVEVSYHSLEGRRLDYSGDDNRMPLRLERIGTLPLWKFQGVIDVVEVVSDPEKFARSLVDHLFARFNYEPDEAFVIELQEKYRR